LAGPDAVVDSECERLDLLTEHIARNGAAVHADFEEVERRSKALVDSPVPPRRPHPSTNCVKFLVSMTRFALTMVA
jgi:hypothetical protein